MKKLLMGLCAIFICTFAIAHTINWHVGDTIIQTTTCNSGDNITPPTVPSKRGYHLKEWNRYQFLEYIESTGTQYIDTDLKANNETKVEIRYQTPSSAVGTNTWALLGARAYYANDHVVDAFIIGSNNGQIAVGSSKIFAQFSSTTNYIINNIPDVDLNVHTLQLSKQGFYQDGVLKRSFDDIATFTTNNNIVLFAASNETLNYGIWKIYSFKMWQDAVLVRNLIPCKNASNVVGMYDTVTDTFFTNQGTGEFIAGPMIGGL